jgi:TPR repeat protein
MAAVQGCFVAQLNIASVYLNGRGFPRDHAEALKWYRMAADQGIASPQYAQWMIGRIYQRGEGIPQDTVEAYKWFYLAASQGNNAASQGDTKAVAERDRLRTLLTPVQITEGQRRVAEWKAKHSTVA